MDIKTLLGKDAEELEKLSDAQLLEYFSPYLKWIKPEVEKNDEQITKRKYDQHYEAKKTLQMAEELAKKYGIKI